MSIVTTVPKNMRNSKNIASEKKIEINDRDGHPSDGDL